VDHYGVGRESELPRSAVGACLVDCQSANKVEGPLVGKGTLVDVRRPDDRLDPHRREKFTTPRRRGREHESRANSFAQG
jgi:hypothetical protein